MGTYTTNKSLYKPAYKEVQYHTLVNGNFDTIDDEVLWLEFANANTCSVAGGTSFIRLSGLQVDGVAMTGTLRGAYIDVSNGSTAATGTIRAMELKARTEAPGDTGNDVAVLEGLSISADSKGHSVTTVMRAAEFICDGSAGGTIAEMVGLRLANNLQANKATKSFGLEIYKDSFQSTADIRIFEVGGGGNYIGFLGPSSIAADVVWTLPSADGSANQVIKTNGSGALSWVTAVFADIFDANTILAANTDNTPAAVTIAEQRVVGRLTGGNIAAVTIGIADNNIVQIDHAGPADDDYAKFTANGLEGRSYAEVLGDLTGANLDVGAFDVRGQTVTADGLTAGRLVYTGASGLLSAAAAGAWDGSTLGIDGAAVFNNSEADKDFRIATNGATNTFFIQGSNGWIGIGTATLDADVNIVDAGNNSQTKVHIDTYNDQTTNYNSFLAFRKSHSDTKGTMVSTIDTEYLGVIEFRGADVDGPDFRTGATITVIQNDAAAATTIPVDMYITVDTGNLGLNVSAFDATAAGCFAIGNGTEPAAHTDNQIYLYSKDATVVGGATLGIFSECDVEVGAPAALSHKIRVWWNGVEYWLGLDAV